MLSPMNNAKQFPQRYPLSSAALSKKLRFQRPFDKVYRLLAYKQDYIRKLGLNEEDS